MKSGERGREEKEALALSRLVTVARGSLRSALARFVAATRARGQMSRRSLGGCLKHLTAALAVRHGLVWRAHTSSFKTGSAR